MFHSQSLSTKGPLGSIWVAAYCHKRLKKAQVTATDIPFSVDKILQDEFEVITYRVLGYFLLGVVRIYSKKVEYLFNDCHKVLIQVKGFVVSEKSRARASKSKLLDVPIGLITLPKRFELDAFDLEVGEDAAGTHEMPQEAITLKDNTWKYERMGQYAIREYKWEDVAGRHDICSIDNTEAENIIPLAYMDAETGEGNSVGLLTFNDNESLNEDKQAEGEQMRNPKGAFLSERDKCVSDEHDLSNLEVNVDRLQEDVERAIRNASFNAGDKCLVNEDHDLSNLEYTIERLRESREIERENQDFNMVTHMDGETRELVAGEAEVDLIPEGAHKPSETVPLQSPEPDVAVKDRPISLRVDSTPPAKLLDTAEGGPTPEFILIPTPTPKERALTKRKRKSLFDDLIVLPNDLVKKSIRDASDLVCKRRKAPHDTYTIWKATRALGFSEPLVPYSSSELRSLHYEKNLKMSVPCKDVEVPEKVKVSEPPSGDGSSEQAGIAPETPVRQFSSKRPSESPKASRSEEMMLESPSGSATLEKEPLAAEDHGLSPILMDEDLNSAEEGTDKLYGWTGRTRTVARHLNEVFRKQKGEDEAASLLQISEGRTRKECARLFYEILVLQCKGYINVEQETSYADVLIRKQPEWERAFDFNNSKHSG